MLSNNVKKEAPPPPPQPNPTQYTYTHLKSTIKEIYNLRICTLHFGRSRASDGIIQNPEEGKVSKGNKTQKFSTVVHLVDYLFHFNLAYEL